MESITMDHVMYLVDVIQPTAAEFSSLRVKVGWGATNLEMAQRSLENSLFHVTARIDNKLIGMGRVIGDGVMFFYVQDVVVDPDFQQQGVGGALMQEIEQYLSITAQKGSTVALLSAQGKESFYARYGYSERSGDPLGKGMCKFI
ncbi:N-acetyltransferase [Shewanella hanedai]|nr:N-acetyltransferase [Shewanella hanedai]